MKVKKEDLDKATQAIADLGLTTIALLVATGCPSRKLYDNVQKHLELSQTLRKELELENLVPEGKSWAELVDRGYRAGRELSQAVMEALEDGEGHRAPIGFQAPQTDPSKMN
jgi:hypothetical protein